LDGWEVACKKLHELCWWPHPMVATTRAMLTELRWKAKYKLSRTSVMDV
jgi:hypothetical protein